MTQRWYLAAVLAGICLLPGCRQRAEPEAESTTAAATAPPAPVLPVVDPPFNREALLLAVMRAASDSALGRPALESQRKLDGRRFELRMRFGCPNAAEGDRSRSWEFDDRRRKLTVRVEPEITADSPQVRDLGATGYEAVEGFWIRRPWMLTADCPARPASAPVSQDQPAGETKQTSAEASPQLSIPHIGIAQFFTSAEPRTHRRDARAYSATKVLAEGVSPNQNGYDLVITGRLRQLASGSVITCANQSPAVPPDCIVSAQFESVAIKHPVSGETIAEWTSG